MPEFKESEHPRDKDGKFTKKGKSSWLSSRKKALETIRKMKRNTIKLPDEILPKSVGAKWGNYEIAMPDGTIAHFVEGSKIQNKEVFAGYGTRTPIRDIDRLNRIYKTNSNKWQKVKANAQLIVHGEEIKCEIHWYEEPSVGKVEIKFKKEL